MLDRVAEAFGHMRLAVAEAELIDGEWGARLSSRRIVNDMLRGIGLPEPTGDRIIGVSRPDTAERVRPTARRTRPILSALAMAEAVRECVVPLEYHRLVDEIRPFPSILEDAAPRLGTFADGSPMISTSAPAAGGFMHVSQCVDLAARLGSDMTRDQGIGLTDVISQLLPCGSGIAARLRLPDGRVLEALPGLDVRNGAMTPAVTKARFLKALWMLAACADERTELQVLVVDRKIATVLKPIEDLPGGLHVTEDGYFRLKRPARVVGFEIAVRQPATLPRPDITRRGLHPDEINARRDRSLQRQEKAA